MPKKNAPRTRRSPLSHRMKAGELYVVYSGFDGKAIHLMSYGDAKRTPRIYKKDAVDDRLCNSLPVCRNMGTAEKVLGGATNAVLLPLSDMIYIWGERTVKSWAKAQGHVDPADVREYVNRHSSKRSVA